MTRVIKIGGRAQSAPALATAIAQAVAAGPVVIVHGGGDEVSALQQRLGMTPRFEGGRRVTSEADLDLVRMVLSGVTNKRLVGSFTAAGVRAVGISGEDGALLRGTVARGAPLGRVGEALAADATVLRDLIAAGWTPVVSPLATDADDTARGALNVNGDDAAAAIATALGASELLLVADVPGVLRDGAVLPALDATAVAALAASGVATGGMLAKLEAAMRVATAGVTRVRIGALDAITDHAVGTRITHDLSTLEPQLR